MTGQTLAAIITACVITLGMLGGVLSLTYRMGHLSGQIISFMTTSQRDRTEVLTELGKMDARLERHIEQHDRGIREARANSR